MGIRVLFDHGHIGAFGDVDSNRVVFAGGLVILHQRLPESVGLYANDGVDALVEVRPSAERLDRYRIPFYAVGITVQGLVNDIF